MYSAAVLDHFKNPHNAGELPNATVAVHVSNPACGDVLALMAVVEHGRIADVRFKASGCVSAIAAGSMLTDMIAGRAVKEARAVTPERISEALGGLPPATFHAAQLARDALESLLAKL